MSSAVDAAIAATPLPIPAAPPRRGTPPTRPPFPLRDGGNNPKQPPTPTPTPTPTATPTLAPSKPTKVAPSLASPESTGVAPTPASPEATRVAPTLPSANPTEVAPTLPTVANTGDNPAVIAYERREIPHWFGAAKTYYFPAYYDEDRQYPLIDAFFGTVDTIWEGAPLVRAWTGTDPLPLIPHYAEVASALPMTYHKFVNLAATSIGIPQLLTVLQHSEDCELMGSACLGIVDIEEDPAELQEF